MNGRYRPFMDPLDTGHQAPEPHWIKSSDNSDEITTLRGRIRELEEQNKAYEELLSELPELFERKFQQRLEPLLERYRLLAEQSSDPQAGKPALVAGESTNVVRLPLPRIPALLRRRQRSA